MARNAFGGSVSDYVVSFYTLGSSKLAAFTAATLTFFDAEAGGNQVTDLALNADGSSPVTQVSVPATGDVPTFYGPDGVTQLWVSANGSASRVKMVSLEAAAAAVTSAQAAASEAAGHATDAASSATAAEQAAASVPATTDAAMAPVLSDPESASAGVLAAAIALGANLAKNPDLLIDGAVTRDGNGAALSAPVAWPDGTPGTYTADAVSSAFPGAVDGYHITYGSPPTKTFTQPTITRDPATGAATNVPALVVS